MLKELQKIVNCSGGVFWYSILGPSLIAGQSLCHSARFLILLRYVGYVSG